MWIRREMVMILARLYGDDFDEMFDKDSEIVKTVTRMIAKI